MNTRFGQWVDRYRPTFLYIGIMCAIYILMVWVFMNVLWPLAFQNAEPTRATAQSTVKTVISQRAAFKDEVQVMYIRMGALALILYLLYCTNGWLTMVHTAHVRFSKDLRLATISCYLTFALDECAAFFIISVHESWWDSFKLIMIFISILSCVGWILKPLVRSTRKKNRPQNGRKFTPVLYSLMAILLFIVMTFYDGILAMIYNGFKEFLNPSANPILSDSTRYVLQLNVDTLLPLFLIVPLSMLWFAMWYASPVSASTPFSTSTSSRGHVYSLVHNDFPN
jgi:hypothetical protein